jgi:hypothetical protein
MNTGRQMILLTALLGIFAVLQAEERVKFSHKKHVKDAGLECLNCHAAATENNGGGKINHPKMEACKQCHEDAMTGNNCGMCHVSGQSKKPFAVELHHKNFSHQAHLKRNVQCAFCHKDVDKTDYATEKNLPSMGVCFSCHNDKTAPRHCRICHEDPSLKRTPSHDVAGFEGRRHGLDARFEKLLCEKCHEESSCDQCHRGHDRRKVHPPDIQWTHGFEAKKGDKNCTYCHESERFCARCHEGRK